MKESLFVLSLLLLLLSVAVANSAGLDGLERSVPAVEGVRINLHATAKQLATPAPTISLPKLAKVKAAAAKLGPLPALVSPGAHPVAIQVKRATEAVHKVENSLTDIHQEMQDLAQKEVAYYPEPKKVVFKTDPFAASKAKLEKDRKKLAVAQEKGRKKARTYKELDHKKTLQEKSKKIDANLLKVRRHENGVKAKERNVKMDNLAKRRAAIKLHALKEKVAKVKENAHKVNKERRSKKFLRERTTKRNTLEATRKRAAARRAAARYEKQTKSLAKQRVSLKLAEAKSKEAKHKAAAKYESAIKRGKLERKKKAAAHAATRKANAQERKMKHSEYRLKMEKIKESSNKAKAQHSENAIKKLRMQKLQLMRKFAAEKAKKRAEKAKKRAVKRAGEKARKQAKARAKQAERLTKAHALAAERKVKLGSHRLAEKTRKEKRAKSASTEAGSKRRAAAKLKERKVKSLRVLEKGRKSREKKTKAEKQRKRVAAAKLKVCMRLKRSYYAKMHRVVLQCKRLAVSRRNACYASLQRKMTTWYATVRTHCHHRGNWACLRAKKYFSAFMHRRLAVCKKKKTPAQRKSCLHILKVNKPAWYGSVVYSCMTPTQRAKYTAAKERAAKRRLHTAAARERATKKAVVERTSKRLAREKVRKRNRAEKLAKRKERAAKALIMVRLAAAMRKKNERQTKRIKVLEKTAKGEARRTKEKNAKSVRLARCRLEKKRYRTRINAAANRCLRKVGASKEACLRVMQTARGAWFTSVAAYCTHRGKHACVVAKAAYKKRVYAATGICKRKASGTARAACMLSLKVKSAGWYHSVAYACTTRAHAERVIKANKAERHTKAVERHSKAHHRKILAAARLRAEKSKKAAVAKALERARKAAKARHTAATERAVKRTLAIERASKAAAKRAAEKKAKLVRNRCLSHKAAYFKRVHNYAISCAAQKAHASRQMCYKRLKSNMRVWYVPVRVACHKRSHWRCLRAKLAFHRKVSPRLATCAARSGSARKSCLQALTRAKKAWYPAVKKACPKHK